MKTKIILFTLFVALLFTAGSALAGDASLTKNITFDSWITINLEKDGLIIKEIRFSTTDTETKSSHFFGGYSKGPYATYEIYNNTSHDMEYGIAIALFDKNHTLITASDYTQIGKLNPGEHKEDNIIFGPVNMRYREATYFKIVLEAK
jgi:hypothetical protein